MTTCVALAVFRRDPAANRYVDTKFGVFRRVPLGANEEATVSADGLADSNEYATQDTELPLRLVSSLTLT